MKLYYISFHGTASAFTRCFSTEEERAEFAKRVKPSAMWEAVIA